MVVAYAIMGGFLFRALEAPAEQREKLKILSFREQKIDEIINSVIDFHLKEIRSNPLGNLSREELEGSLNIAELNATIRSHVVEFQEGIKSAVKDMGWDGNDDIADTALQWSLAGAILYAVTVITTIGTLYCIANICRKLYSKLYCRIFTVNILT